MQYSSTLLNSTKPQARGMGCNTAWRPTSILKGMAGEADRRDGEPRNNVKVYIKTPTATSKSTPSLCTNNYKQLSNQDNPILHIILVESLQYKLEVKPKDSAIQ